MFWEGHDPTQGMRQGNDIGTQYRTAIYTTDRRAARGRRGQPRRCSRSGCTEAGYGEITTEIAPLGDFFYAEPYHQQYLAKNPNGYCGIGGTGVSCPDRPHRLNSAAAIATVVQCRDAERPRRVVHALT